MSSSSAKRIWKFQDELCFWPSFAVIVLKGSLKMAAEVLSGNVNGLCWPCWEKPALSSDDKLDRIFGSWDRLGDYLKTQFCSKEGIASCSESTVYRKDWVWFSCDGSIPAGVDKKFAKRKKRRTKRLEGRNDVGRPEDPKNLAVCFLLGVGAPPADGMPLFQGCKPAV